jgi:hypothetical protein
MQAIEKWAAHKAWGVDVFVTVLCECGRRSGHSSSVLFPVTPTGASALAVVDCHCPGCTEREKVNVDVVEALEVGATRTPEPAVIEEAR